MKVLGVGSFVFLGIIDVVSKFAKFETMIRKGVWWLGRRVSLLFDVRIK